MFTTQLPSKTERKGSAFICKTRPVCVGSIIAHAGSFAESSAKMERNMLDCE
jgi:hypothetical protein